MGAHSLGRATYSESGFDGGWTATQSSFSNNYYKVSFFFTLGTHIFKSHLLSD